MSNRNRARMGLLTAGFLAIFMAHRLPAQPDKPSVAAPAKASATGEKPLRDPIDYYLVTKQSEVIPLSSKYADSKPGQLVTLGFAEEPIFSEKSLPGAKYAETRATDAEAIVVSSRDTSAKSRSVQFKVNAALGGNSAEFAHSSSESSSTHHEKLYVVLSATTSVCALTETPSWPKDWPVPPAGEDPLSVMGRRFGTHMIRRTLMGREAFAEVEIRESSSERRAEACAALKAAFLAVRFDGSYNSSEFESTSRFEYGLRVKIRAGAAKCAPERLICTSPVAFQSLLGDLQSGRIKLESTPLYGELATLSEQVPDPAIAKLLRGSSPPVFERVPPKPVTITKRVSCRHTEPAYSENFMQLAANGVMTVYVPFPRQMPTGTEVKIRLASWDGPNGWIGNPTVSQDRMGFNLEVRTQTRLPLRELDFFFDASGQGE